MHNKFRGYATLIAVLMMLPLLAIMPVPVSATITGYRQTLYVVSSYTYSGSNLASISTAYSDIIQTHIDAYAPGDLVAINTTGMTIGGASVWLFVSESGGASIADKDLYYAGPFPVANITMNYASQGYEFQQCKDPLSGEMFWLGSNFIIGPMPTHLVTPRGVPYRAKMIDVDPALYPQRTYIPSSDVAVSYNQWVPFPSLTITPTKGPAGTRITVTCVAWDPNKIADISYAAANNAPTPRIWQDNNHPNGNFTFSYAVPDSYITSATDLQHYVNGYYDGTTSVLASATFVENGRRWLQIDGSYGPAGNNFKDGNVTIGQTIYVSAKYANPGGKVTLYWDYGNPATKATLASNIAVDNNGFFNVSVTVPVSGRGTHTITFVDLTFNLNATVTNVTPATFTIKPTSGPVGTNVNGYGYAWPYPATITIQWDYTACPEKVPKTPVNLTTVSTNPNGTFTTWFTVPHTVGGPHTVSAITNGYVASATFTVTVQLTISPDPAMNNGTIVTVTGTGLQCVDWYDLDISVNKDFGSNSSGTPSYFKPSLVGDMTFQFPVDASFDPGMHAITLYKMTTDYSLPTRDTTAMFTVAGTSDIMTKLNAIQTSISNLQSYVSSTSTGLPSLSTQIAAVNTAISDARTALSTQITGVSSQLTTIATSAQTAATAATSASTAAQSASTSAAGAQTAAQSASTSAAGAQTAAQNAQSTASSIQTAVYLAVILALIAALAAIVAVIILQRKVA
jgi:hypothetical protein